MSSDNDDFLDYTPLRRSQVSTREVKPKPKSSRLSLTCNQSQNTDKKVKIKTTPSKSSSSKVSKAVKKKTPIKSRADQPEENCSGFQLAKWKFLFGSEVSKADEKPQALKRKSDSGGESSRDSFAVSQQKKKSVSEESVPQSTENKQDGAICFHCKFPLSKYQKPFHSILCESKDLSQLPRCPAGSKCCEVTEQHFWKNNHNEGIPNISVESSYTAVKTSTNKDLMTKTDPNNSSTCDSGYNGTAGPSRPRVPFTGAASHDSPDVVVLSDVEESIHCHDHKSEPLFDLKENEECKADTKKKSNNLESSHESSNLLDSFIPDIELFEDDQSTVFFGEQNNPTQSSSFNEHDEQSAVFFGEQNNPTQSSSFKEHDEQSTVFFGEQNNPTRSSSFKEHDEQSAVSFDEQNNPTQSSSFKEHSEQENQNTPVNHDEDEDFGSETPDLRKSGTETEELEDPEGDELIASMAEEAINQFALPAFEKVLKWRRDCLKTQARTPSPQKTSRSSDLRKSHKTVVQPVCIHLHYHEAGPAPSPSKESGQTSILNYFKPTNFTEESCLCGEKKTFSKQKNIENWRGLMDRRQKKNLVPLPSVFPSSSSETFPSQSSKIQHASGGTRPRWKRKDATEAKTCPFYKYIPDTSFVVDAFSYGPVEGVTAYFLSHFHYDHYCGLRRDFSHPIYCSEITAKLVNKRLQVPLQYLNPLPMWEPQQVCGVEVTLLDANHCPGAVMFVFKVKPGVTYLHVGDFRAHPSMESYPALHTPIDTLFLDTTYCSPEHVFPTQERMIEKCVSLAQDHHQRNNRTLFVVGSYTIGKEKVFKAIASRLNCSIWVRNYKRQVLNCINDKEIQARLTDCRTSAKVHVLPMSELKGQKLKDYLNQLKSSFSEIVGMCPTGWEFTGVSSSRGSDDITSKHPFPDVHIYGIPYSEHSSFNELKQFVQFIKPRKIIPTVNNGNQENRKRMQQHFSKWQTTRQLFS